ncbi:MAG: hypothetical protein ABR915_15490 [Thermoguttaceae bacterium]
MRHLILLAGLSAAVALGGCAATRCVQCGGEPEGPPPPAGKILAERPPTPTPDLSGLPPSAVSAPGGKGLPIAGPHRAFEAMDAQCRAVAVCPLANALAVESQKAACPDRQSDEVKSQVLAFRAVEERNKAAGQAMELFYLLAEAEAGLDLLHRSKENLAAMLEDVDRLEKQGIRVERGLAELRRQWPDALDREAQAHLAVEQANSHLRQLLGFSPEETEPIWPSADWRVIAEPLDEQAAICTGLSHRPDIGLLAMLAQSVDDETVEGARAGLSALPGLPASPVASHLLHGHKSGKCGSRGGHFDELLAYRQQEATEEIRLAVRTIGIRLQQIAIAKLKVDGCQNQIESLRLRRTRGDTTVSVLDVGAAEMQLLQQQNELAHQVMAWRIAQIKLKQAQGLLAFECGMGCGP